MEKSYATPEMIVHGTIEEITQLGGVNTPLDVLIFNGQVIATSDGSSSLDCDNNNNCDPFKLQ